jgi:hypothetical protein
VRIIAAGQWCINMKLRYKLTGTTCVILMIYGLMGIFYSEIMTYYYRISCNFPLAWECVKIEYEDRMYYRQYQDIVGIYFVGEEKDGGVFLKKDSYIDYNNVNETFNKNTDFELISIEKSYFNNNKSVIVKQRSASGTHVKSIILLEKGVLLSYACREGHEARFQEVLNKIRIME